MIIVKNIDDLEKYKELIESFKLTNYQQTYNNIYSIHLSNYSAKTYISDNMVIIDAGHGGIGLVQEIM